MNRIITRKALVLTTLLAMSGLLLSGCFKKHIESAPPARRPAAESAPVTPAPKPAVVEDTPEVIEETYVVDAPEADAPPAAKVEEADLDAETIVTEEVVKVEEKKVEESAVVAPETTPVAMGEMFYIQVGAFSDMENANNVLSKLIGEGYKGSKLVDTGSGLYRVQAGAFADQDAANEALSKLQNEYPKGFILKSTPQE